MKVNVGVSKRHVHLTEDSIIKLFGTNELPVRNNLSQPGQFASTYTVDLKNNNKIIPHVRVVGPARSYNQIEIDESDSKELELNPPTRRSGDLDNSLGITLIGPKGEITLNSGVIKAKRHVHLDNKTAQKENLQDNEIVEIFYNDNYILDAEIKVTEDAYNELHIDTFEEIRYDLSSGEEVEIKKCGK